VRNEFDRYGCGSDYGKLREVVVGISDDLVLPPFGEDLSHYNDELRGILESSRGEPVSIRDALPERFERATEQLEQIVSVYESRGIVVHRPRKFSEDEKEYLGSLQRGHNQLYPADPVFMLGNHFLELNIRRAYRRKEVFPLRDVVLPLIENDLDVHHVAMPHARPFDPSGSGPGPYLEGGDILVTGPDVIVGLNDALCSNRAGVDWLTRILEPHGYHIHPMPVEGKLLHGLGVMALIREGLLLAYLESLPNGLPEPVKGWDVIALSFDEASQFATVGVSLDPETYLVDEVNVRVIDELSRRNVECIPLAASDLGFFGGNIRCATLPIMRTD
jgi:N-dimethylarginine dimethylaminohydrolase